MVSVSHLDNTARTQNGHIRNDTRDASRTILNASVGPICRENRVARDRACTRVTLQNLHGKEGVDGSSPSEGSKIPGNRDFLSPELVQGAPHWEGGVTSGAAGAEVFGTA
jgi:hypothetical protein